MNEHNLVSPPSALDSQFAINGISAPSVQVAATSSASECLYQLAALTAGIFFLATLI
jgi:hypothetical protein